MLRSRSRVEALGRDLLLVSLAPAPEDEAGAEERDAADEHRDRREARERELVDWEPGRLTWYVDGVATKTLNEAPALNMYLIANLAVANGSRAPAPNASTPLPSSLKIDNIRAWKR